MYSMHADVDFVCAIDVQFLYAVIRCMCSAMSVWDMAVQFCVLCTSCEWEAPQLLAQGTEREDLLLCF